MWYKNCYLLYFLIVLHRRAGLVWSGADRHIMSSSPWRGSVVTRCREPCRVSCVSFLSWWQSRPGDSTGGWGTVTPSETTRTTRSGRSRAVMISDLDSLFQISNNQYQDNGQVQGELFILHYSFFQHSILITLPRKLPSIKYVQSQDIVKKLFLQQHST